MLSDAQPNQVLYLQAVQYTYPNSHSGISVSHWQVNRGEQIFLHGPSGSGKTTLLNLLAGIISPDTGNIAVLGEQFSGLSERQRDLFRARHIGVVFQQFNLISHLTVAQNIALAAHFAGQLRSVEQRIEQLIMALKLPTEVLTKKAGQLSVGQQQRVAIARALINQPEVLLVDEPTSALDASSRDAFMQLLIELCNAHQTTLLFVSHDESLSKYLEKRLALSEIIDMPEVRTC
ncbi:MAG: ABC transporter ATP-binding protein [Alteromonadaceae bacterium]|nr:ABC transporter ATP-binding protein [Alteromonadaceae bacterium]